MRSLAASLAVLALSLASCRSVGGGDTAELLDADRSFCADTQARRIEGWVAAFDVNGSQFDEDNRPITGHIAIRARMTDFFARPEQSLTWEPDHALISEAGKLGMTSGRFKMTLQRDDGTIETVLTGRYFDVWRKHADGTWKLVVDIGEADAPPSTSEGS